MKKLIKKILTIVKNDDVLIPDEVRFPTLEELNDPNVDNQF